MSDSGSLDAIIRAVREHGRFAVCGHVRPDPDCIGSQLALSIALKRLGKEARVWLADGVPENCSFLPGAGGIEVPGDEGPGFDIAIVLDTPRPERLGKIAGRVLKIPVIVNIDHHASNILWGKHNWVDKNASSTAELIYRLLNGLGVETTGDIATCLYVGILTDTGRFCYSNSTPEALRIAAELLKKGVSPAEVAVRVYGSFRPRRMKLLARALHTLEVDEGGELAWLWITREMYRESGASPEDADGIVNYARDMAGVKVAVLLEEGGDGESLRVSLRSTDRSLNVDEIAARYGGGGHPAAAGAVIRGEPRSAGKRLLDEIRSELAKARRP